MNMQNNDRSSRHVFKATPGHILLTADYSQIESRIVNCLTGDPELIEMALRMPWEWDEHCYIASITLGKPIEEITREPLGGERYWAGKRPNHASNYLMGGKLLSDLLLKEGIIKSAKECDVLIGRIMDRFPAKRDWQRSIWDEIVAERVLYSPVFNRHLSFQHMELGRSAWGTGCAFKPQSCAGDMLNQYGLIPIDRWITEQGYYPERAAVVAQVHDSFTLDIEPELAWRAWSFLYEEMQREVEINGVKLRVPVGLKMSKHWGDEGVSEFKRPPTQAEFERVVEKEMKK